MATPRHFRVFISSPGDVLEERKLATTFIKEELPYDPFVRGRATIELVSWDDPSSPVPMLGNLTPQQAVDSGLPKPSQCDFVVVVLWGRFGTPLPDTFRKPSGERYLSGTEWEFEDAFSARTPPDILLYRRTEKILIDIDDPDKETKVEQLRRVRRFFEQFRSADGSLAGAYTNYDNPISFLDRLSKDLRTLIARKLAGVVERTRPGSGAGDVSPGSRRAPLQLSLANKRSLSFVHVPAAPEQGIDLPFLIGARPLSADLVAWFLHRTNSTSTGESRAVHISRDEASVVIRRISDCFAGRTFRLPTAEELEIAWAAGSVLTADSLASPQAPGLELHRENAWGVFVPPSGCSEWICAAETGVRGNALRLDGSGSHTVCRRLHLDPTQGWPYLGFRLVAGDAVTSGPREEPVST